MKTNAWVFLVSRNQSVDYQTVVAPDFIDAAKLRGLLTKVTDSDLTPPAQANIRWIRSSTTNNFSIVFRVIKARATDIGEASGDILTDSFGRAIYLVEGLVFREDPNFLRKSIESYHLEQAHTKALVHYQCFWGTNATAISHCFPWQAGNSSQILKLEELEPIVLPPKPRKTGMSNKGIVPANTPPQEQMKHPSKFLPILVGTSILVILFISLIGNFFFTIDNVANRKYCAYVTQLKLIS